MPQGHPRPQHHLWSARASSGPNFSQVSIIQVSFIKTAYSPSLTPQLPLAFSISSRWLSVGDWHSFQPRDLGLWGQKEKALSTQVCPLGARVPCSGWHHLPPPCGLRQRPGAWSPTCWWFGTITAPLSIPLKWEWSDEWFSATAPESLESSFRAGVEVCG